MTSQEPQSTDIEFYSALANKVREQITELDQNIRELYRQRDRLQFFLNDLERHK